MTHARITYQGIELVVGIEDGDLSEVKAGGVEIGNIIDYTHFWLIQAQAIKQLREDAEEARIVEPPSIHH